MAWVVERLESCTSTQDEAKARAREGAPDGTVVMATKQTAGRGQHGRSWESPEGGIYLSVVLRGIDDPRLLTLALGNAVADVLEVAGVEPRLKWVNDVWIEGRKVAGLLAEAESTGDKVDFIVAGLGLNVNEPEGGLPASIRDEAVTLQTALETENCVEDVETFLLQELERWVEEVRQGHDQAVLSAWRNRDALAGHRVHLASGSDAIEGVARGIDDHGSLLIEGPDGQTTAHDSGTATLRE